MNYNILLKQQQQSQTTDQAQVPTQQKLQSQSIPLIDISNIIAAASHLLPTTTAATTSTATSSKSPQKTATNKPKSNIGRAPLPLK